MDKPVEFLADDAALRLHPLTQRMREAEARVAAQVERSQNACATARGLLLDLERVRNKIGNG
ncbi:MAG TPA: hypothetical protein VE871_10855 [Longimicrobium sp.]|nr:hypothetical protein [Longimicrobium sp.]